MHNISFIAMRELSWHNMAKLNLVQVPVAALAEEVQNQIEEATFAAGQRRFDATHALVGVGAAADELLVAMPDREAMWQLMVFKVVTLKIRYANECV
jgi:hypothetical protein